MLTANVDGSDLYVLDPSGHTSHFIWRDPQHVCMWTKPAGKKAAFYVFKDETREVEIVGDGAAEEAQEAPADDRAAEGSGNE